MTTNYIEIDGVSSNTFGLFCKQLPRFPVAIENVAAYQVSGKQDNMFQSLNHYNDILVQIEAVLRGFRNTDKVFSWLHSGKLLYLSNQPDRIGEIKQITNIEQERIGSGGLSLKITFKCAPFKLASFNPMYTPASNPYYFKTLGTVYSEPIITVYGATEGCTVTVNGVTLTTTGVTGDFVIDVKNRTIYKNVSGEKQSIQDKTSGTFWDMLLVPSESDYNVISYTNADSITFVANERWL